MTPRLWLAPLGALLLVGASGCPVTDDYYLESSHVHGVSGNTGQTTLASGGSAAAAGKASSGSGGSGSVGGSSAATAGAGDVPAGGATDVAAAGSSATETCTAATERCNGHDDDCDDVVDELACNSMSAGTIGCSGFVLPDDPNHGYMLCTGAKDYEHAGAACAAQNMRLAWLETAAENSAVSKKVAALSIDAEVTFGATDAAKEDEWYWDGGVQFWKGDENGQPVGGLFNAWTDGTPNDENQNEDCAVLMSATAAWGDRSCDAKYSYLCEEMN
ncbi:MAG TPA: C-type lectin domain-containing protein [Polyangiaceae bacterium]|nr:C-type lectin domain-containing protein [Polyangiaceae bacterium]